MITEAAYPGNVGFQEMVEFYREASREDISAMEKIVKRGDWAGFKDLIRKVLKITLK